MKKYVGMSVGMVCLALVGQSAGSVLIDPDFEANDLTLGWDFPDYGTALVAETGPSSAPGDSLCVGITLADSTAHYAQAVAKAFPVEPGKDYKLTLDYKQPAGSSGEILVQVRFCDGVAPGGYNEWPASGLPNHQGDFNMTLPESVGAWSTVNSGVITTIPGATHMDMRVLMNELGVSTVGIVLADNIELIAIDPPVNMLLNSGFETEGGGGVSDAADWVQTHAQIVRVAQVNSAGHGDFVLQRGDSVAGFHWAAQTVAVTAGVEYTASAEFKGLMQAGEIAYIYIGWLDSGGAEISNTLSTYTTVDADYIDFAWVSRSATGIAPVGAVNAQVRAMTYLDGLGDSGLWSDNVALIEADPIDPATILSFSSVSSNVLKMVVNAPSSAENYYPKSKTDLLTGTWGSVPHSDDGVNPFVVTNLGYSTTDATGTNEVIYVNAINSAAFFGIGEE